MHGFSQEQAAFLSERVQNGVPTPTILHAFKQEFGEKILPTQLQCFMERRSTQPRRRSHHHRKRKKMVRRRILAFH
jgi:hypothetical protein